MCIYIYIHTYTHIHMLIHMSTCALWFLACATWDSVPRGCGTRHLTIHVLVRQDAWFCFNDHTNGCYY